MSWGAKVAIQVRIQMKKRRAEGKELVVMIGTMTQKKQDNERENGPGSDSVSEMREGEWVIAVACAESELLFKAGTKPSILEMIKIYNFCSFEYGSDQENRRKLEVYLQAMDRKEQNKKLKEAINFLNHNDQYVSKKIKAVVDVDYLMNWFIYSLHKRMPKKCEECNDWYHAEIGKVHKLRCLICDIGNHGCKENHVR